MLQGGHLAPKRLKVIGGVCGLGNPAGGWGRLADDHAVLQVPVFGPVYRFWSSAKWRHFHTTRESEKNKLIGTYPHEPTYDRAAYYAFADDSEANVLPACRFWSDTLSTHFHTISEREKDKLIGRHSHVWTYERIAW